MKSEKTDRTWSFLAASPALNDISFEESVVLLLEDNDENSFGIIINKPLGKTLGEIDEKFDFSPLASIPVFLGGPVSKDKFSIVVWRENSENACNFSFGITAEKAEEFLADFPDAKAGVFMGYTAWEKDQLSSEIEQKTWYVSKVDERFILSENCENLWSDILCREHPQFNLLRHENYIDLQSN